MAEWLGSALQKLLQRFESASDLDKSKRLQRKLEPLLFHAVASSLLVSKRMK